ncbi:cysteine hydrolase family protein [Breznakiella homolactica]|uniref:Cysteine hydrolase n=1 Tax=Breznakiella homolactica TaxID=2798577 RepID=A0A7T8B8L4_9SPIR|nr:isochorismatase family cysteine hydrolase [Breznakiella homolactica]QQO08734.1 cysteine hydrolase [Breznakiella homolactica]
MNMALLIIDMQKAYYEGPGKVSMDKAAEYISEALGLFRENGLPIVWIQDADEEDGIVPGTRGYEIIDILKPETGEEIVSKTYSNSFNKTDLFPFLTSRNADTVIITGYSAEYCVLSTYRGAKDHDLFPILLRHGLASDSKENNTFVEDISETVTLNVLRRMVEG